MKEILMSKNKLRWLWYIAAAAVLCLIIWMLYPSIIHSETLYISCIYVVIDAFALSIGYSMLRKLNLFVPWKVIVYLAIIVAGSLAINFFLSEVLYKSLLLFAIIVFTILALLNFALSKIIFSISARDACLIGMLVGLVHALICIAGTSVRI
jgi:hypothetical protein